MKIMKRKIMLSLHIIFICSYISHDDNYAKNNNAEPKSRRLTNIKIDALHINNNGAKNLNGGK